MRKVFNMVLIAALLTSCHSSHCDYHKGVSAALRKAKSNKNELRTVLRHYKAEDREKYDAACYLIANMPDHYSYYGENVQEYHHLVDSVLDANPVNNVYHDTRRISGIVDSLSELYPAKGFKLLSDVNLVSSEFLIRNIDEAFNLWRNGAWATHLDFDEFCEYLLPYTTENKKILEDWRPKVATQIDSSILSTLDTYRFSSEMMHSAFWACKALNLQLKSKFDPDNAPEDDTQIKQLSLLTRLPYGTCEHFSIINVLLMRSIGIPVAMDFTPQWPFRSLGHTWNTVLMNNGKNKSYGGCTQDPEMMHKTEQKMAKVFRRTYAVNQEIKKLNRQSFSVPSTFQDVFIKDVTPDYMETSSVSIKSKRHTLHRYAYLAVFNNREWVPICYGKKKHGKFLFRDIGRDIAYLPVFYTSKGIVAMANPFVLDVRGNIHTLDVSNDETQCVQLQRKYFVAQRIHLYVGRILGGVLEASDNPDFSNAEHLHTITRWSSLPDSITVSAQPHRYWRYLAPDGTNGNLAELEFFDASSGRPIKGDIIGTDGTYYPDNPATGKHAVFDGDPLTYFDAPKYKTSVYVGMDFGKNVEIGKIKYTPRNDDNDISPGDEYELFYWSGSGWASLGKQTAISHKLTYDNVPQNTLLLLRDLTRGKEERIFTYENGEQIWW